MSQRGRDALIKQKLFKLYKSAKGGTSSIFNSNLENNLLKIIDIARYNDEPDIKNMMVTIYEELYQVYDNLLKKNSLTAIDEETFCGHAKILLKIAIYYVDRSEEKPIIDMPGFMKFHGDKISSILEELEIETSVDGGGNKKKRKRTKRRKSKKLKKRKSKRRN